MNVIIYNVHLMNNEQRKESLTLEILQTIEQQNDVTQRHLADRMGVALGLANSYLKRCVHKGWVKIQQVPANRYLYYLTPKGFTEKSRLTAKYLSISFDFYRNASRSINEIYNECDRKKIRKILFCGVSELAEIAAIRAQDHDVHITGIFDPESGKTDYLGLPVSNRLEDISEFDVCLLTAVNDPLKLYEVLLKNFDPEVIFIPSILGISKNQKTT